MQQPATAARSAVLARADLYADALAGGPLAVARQGPILLTGSDRLADETAAELRRLGVSRVVLLGGTAALAPAVEEAVRALGLDVERVSGPTRFGTAASIAELVGGGGAAYLAQGVDPDPARGWPDAVAVGALAAAQGRPILLTAPDALPQETRDALDGVDELVIVGGRAVVSEAVEQDTRSLVTDVSRVAGATRYETSRMIADLHAARGGDPQDTWLVTGSNWPDALAAGPAAAASGGVLLLVDGARLSGSVPTENWLTGRRPVHVTLVGGSAVISEEVRADVARAVGAPP